MPLWGKCVECLGPLPSNGQARQMFCCQAHRKAFQRRLADRGYKLAVPAMVARATRDGTRGDRETGGWATTHARRLMQDWRDEDAAAGRMAMVDYYRLRLKLGMTD